MSDGQLALNTNVASPGLFFKDSSGALVKAGPVHIGTAAPNASPAVGGSAGNSVGELWLDTSLTPNELKTWNGTGWVSATGQEIPVSKLIDGSARQLLQTDAAGTGVEWTSNIDVPGTLDVTSTATFDGRIYTLSGSAGSPAISPAADTNTGVAFTGSGGVILSSEATSVLTVDTTSATADVAITGTLDTTGVASFPIGAEATPGITFNNDKNTGIYSPGADQVAISTGGTGRLFVDSLGRIIAGSSTAQLGVGSATPYFQLHTSIASDTWSSFGSYNWDTSNQGPGYNLYKSRGEVVGTRGAVLNGDTIGRIGFHLDDGTAFKLGAVIRGEAAAAPTASSSPGNLIFATTEAGSNTPQERLRITSDGKVGLGTSAPGDFKFYSYASGSTAATGAYSAAFQTDVDQSANGAPRRIIFSAQNFRPSIEGQLLGAGWTAGDLLINPSGGNVGIGTTAPSYLLHLKSSNPRMLCDVTSTGETAEFGVDPNGALVVAGGAKSILAYTNGSERARIDSSGRLLVGYSSSVETENYVGNAIQPAFQIHGTTGATTALSATSWSNTTAGPSQLVLAKSKGGALGTRGIVAANDDVGVIAFTADDGTSFVPAASILAEVDGTPGANDMPGRLVFSTTADGASSPTERVRITSGGYAKFSNSGSYIDNTGSFHEFNSANTGLPALTCVSATTSFASDVISTGCLRSASSSFSCAKFFSGNGSTNAYSDSEFNLRGDGNGYCDGAWTGGGADYAEYFEWSDSNPDAEDRRGISVVLDGDKIRPAVTGEDPIGVISGNPSVVGDAAWNKWSGKYLRDEFGTYILEDYEVTDDDGNTVIQQRRKLNPAYDPDVEYTSREERPEWDCVGLMGKLRIRKGQPTGSRWIKMRDISDSVEEWLVR
jgi:hypothetical protein